MRAMDVLTFQIRGSCNLVAQAAADAEPSWAARAFPGASAPGFVVWHCARIIDWGINTMVRDAPELGASDEWRDRIRYDMGHGAGLSAADADSVTASVRAADVGAYSRALLDNAGQWLETMSDGDLEAVPDVEARNRAHPRYSTPAALEEIRTLTGVPAWQILARPCVVHIRTHMGELEASLQQLRTRSGQTAGA